MTPGGVRAADGTERPADVLMLATGFASHGFTAPMEIVGSGGRTLAEEWAGVPRAYLGVSVPGFPEHVSALRPEHQRRQRLGHLHDRGRGRARHRRRSHSSSAPTRDGSSSDARRPRPSTASCAPRCAGRSGTPAARTGTSTRTATTRASGRGYGAPIAAGRRRSEPGDYQVGAPAPAADRAA